MDINWCGPATSSRSTGNDLSSESPLSRAPRRVGRRAPRLRTTPIAEGPDAVRCHLGCTLDVVDERGLQTITDELESIIGA